MGELIETMKTEGVGISGWWLSVSGWLPDIISMLVGLATLTYLVIKIKKELI